jgi:hypothetical protein
MRHDDERDYDLDERIDAACRQREAEDGARDDARTVRLRQDRDDRQLGEGRLEWHGRTARGETL